MAGATVSVPAITRPPAPWLRDNGPGWEVEWQPDGHRSVYPARWLDAHAPDGPAYRTAGDGRTEADKEPWAAADLDGRIPSGNRRPSRCRPGYR